VREFRADGAGQFAALPETRDPVTLRSHLAQLPGVKLGPFVDTMPESWIDFSLEGNEFSINNQFGEYWFFVTDPNAPDELLERVASHAQALLGDLAKGRDQLDRRTLAFGYGVSAGVIGVLLLRNLQVGWSILAAAGIALFVGTSWLARLALGVHRKAPRLSPVDSRRND
jgi:hypothetical protein